MIWARLFSVRFGKILSFSVRNFVDHVNSFLVDIMGQFPSTVITLLASHFLC